jgi:adenine-specific DNA-methyltransferase
MGDLKLIRADVQSGLKLIDNGSIQLIITSPPYNIRKVYERDTAMSLDEYLEWFTPIAESLSEKLAHSGSLCWQVGNFIKDNQVFPLDFFFYSIFSKLGLTLRNRIIWRFNFGLHATKRLSGRYETLLWFTKSDKYVFNLDAIRVPQLYPGKRHSARKGPQKSGLPSGNPRGKNPSDFWTFSAADHFAADPVWEIPNVKSAHPEKTIHPCQFPHELAERCILAFTQAGDTVLDPFIGAGTSAVAAIKAGRKSIGIDKDVKYVRLTRKRVEALLAGDLKLRNSGLSVRLPSDAESVARIPIEWLKAAE